MHFKVELIISVVGCTLYWFISIMTNVECWENTKLFKCSPNIPIAHYDGKSIENAVYSFCKITISLPVQWMKGFWPISEVVVFKLFYYTP